MFQSETYTVCDAQFFDRGTSLNYRAWTGTDFTYDKINRGEEYTTLIATDDWDSQYVSFQGNVCVELDVNLTYSSNPIILRFYKGEWGNVGGIFTAQYLGLINEEWNHIKFIYDGTTITAIVNGETKTPLTPTDVVNTFRISLNNTNSPSLKYKNFVIYPI